jgi:hypothetical protein
LSFLPELHKRCGRINTKGGPTNHFCQLWSIFLTTLAQQLLMKLMLYHPFVCHRLRLLLPGWPTRPRSATKGREERRNPCVDPANMIDGTRRRFKSRRALGDGSM